MAKKSRSAKHHTRSADEVGPRQPCPCGSGRRYKHCHGRPGGAPGRTSRARSRACPASATGSHCGSSSGCHRAVDAARRSRLTARRPAEVTVATLLPRLRRPSSGDRLDLDRPQVDAPRRPQPRLRPDPRLALDGGAGRDRRTSPCRRRSPPAGRGGPGRDFDVTVHEGSTSGSPGRRGRPTDGAQPPWSSSTASIDPTARLSSVDAAYWTVGRTKEYLRWVHAARRGPSALTAFARLHAAGADASGPARGWSDVSGTRAAGAGLGPARRHRRRGVGGARAEFAPGSRDALAQRAAVRGGARRP